MSLKHLHSKRRRKDSSLGLDHDRGIKLERQSRKKRHPCRIKQTCYTGRLWYSCHSPWWWTNESDWWDLISENLDSTAGRECCDSKLQLGRWRLRNLFSRRCNLVPWMEVKILRYKESSDRREHKLRPSSTSLECMVVFGKRRHLITGLENDLSLALETVNSMAAR